MLAQQLETNLMVPIVLVDVGVKGSGVDEKRYPRASARRMASTRAETSLLPLRPAFAAINLRFVPPTYASIASRVIADTVRFRRWASCLSRRSSASGSLTVVRFTVCQHTIAAGAYRPPGLVTSAFGSGFLRAFGCESVKVHSETPERPEGVLVGRRVEGVWHLDDALPLRGQLEHLRRPGVDALIPVPLVVRRVVADPAEDELRATGLRPALDRGTVARRASEQQTRLGAVLIGRLREAAPSKSEHADHFGGRATGQLDEHVIAPIAIDIDEPADHRAHVFDVRREADLVRRAGGERDPRAPVLAVRGRGASEHDEHVGPAIAVEVDLCCLRACPAIRDRPGATLAARRRRRGAGLWHRGRCRQHRHWKRARKCARRRLRSGRDGGTAAYEHECGNEPFPHDAESGLRRVACPPSC